MPLQATSGAASYDGFGGGVPFTPTYIEDVFSTWLYNGSASGQTITNGIDLSGKGGLVWFKARNQAYDNILIDTARGSSNNLVSNSTAAQYAVTGGGYISFQSTGFALNGGGNIINDAGDTEASWTFRKQPKFFDVVTYTGDGSSTRTISHNLGSTPGFVIIKNIDQTGNWMCWHNSFAATDYIALNTTGAKNYAGTLTDIYKGVSSTTVTIGSNAVVNNNSYNYVMYVFAHDAGGFGLTGTDNVISCGSYTGTGAAGNAITLGYEPQWVLIKRTDSTGNWGMTDTMRGMSVTNNAVLYSNLSNAELDAGSPIVYPTATGFTCGTGSAGWNASGGTYIYIAIRRGPMKTPTSGTSVFSPDTSFSSGAATTNFPVDSMWANKRSISNSDQTAIASRLTGQAYSVTSQTYAEGTDTGINFASNTQSIWTGFFASGVRYSFRRAPGFFDVVCYTGNNVNNRQLPHNLGVVPELVINKSRSNPTIWYVWVNGVSPTNKCLILNLTLDWASGYNTGFQSSTSTNLNISTASGEINISGETYVAYLFASCPGVSKVGTYTGTGALQTINCGFTGGARFVLIKRTDSTGDWWVYDSARGISSGNDPYLLINSATAEVTGTNYVDTDSTGFKVTAAAPAGLNASGGTYIYLAIA